MDLEKYIQKSKALGNSKSVDKKCLNCGKKLDNTNSHLYYQGFCSSFCKENYVR